MLTLVIVNEKYLTLNISKEPNFIFTFLVKPYISLLYPNSQAYFFPYVAFYYIRATATYYTS